MRRDTVSVGAGGCHFVLVQCGSSLRRGGIHERDGWLVYEGKDACECEEVVVLCYLLVREVRREAYAHARRAEHSGHTLINAL